MCDFVDRWVLGFGEDGEEFAPGADGVAVLEGHGFGDLVEGMGEGMMKYE
jgi:hypothetical protein